MPLALQTFSSVKDASAALHAAGTRYLGGGTLVVRAANEGDISISTLVRATDPSLSSIEVAGGRATIGASVTMAEIARHPDLSMLARVARSVGGPAIRNMATVGGNLFAPAPYGDFAVALLALDAEILVGGEYIGIDEFMLVRDDLSGGRIVEAVRFEMPAAESFRFLKISRVKPKGISVLSIAAIIKQDAGNAITHARIALGSMADRPIRIKAAEQALIGQPLTKAGIADALAVACQGLSPPTDAIASSWYRTEVLPVHLGRLLLS